MQLLSSHPAHGSAGRLERRPDLGLLQLGVAQRGAGYPGGQHTLDNFKRAAPGRLKLVRCLRVWRSLVGVYLGAPVASTRPAAAELGH